MRMNLTKVDELYLPKSLTTNRCMDGVAYELRRSKFGDMNIAGTKLIPQSALIHRSSCQFHQLGF